MTVDIYLLEQDLNDLWPPPHVRLIRTMSIFRGRGASGTRVEASCRRSEEQTTAERRVKCSRSRWRVNEPSWELQEERPCFFDFCQSTVANRIG